MEDIDQRLSDIENNQRVILALLQSLGVVFHQFGKSAARAIEDSQTLGIQFDCPHTIPISMTPSAPKERAKRQSKSEKMIQAYKSSTIEHINQLLDCWPSTRGKGDNQSKIVNDAYLAAGRWEAILSSGKGVEEADLFNSTIEWLATKPEFANAIQFYLGPGKPGVTPPWEIELRGYLTRKQKETVQ